MPRPITFILALTALSLAIVAGCAGRSGRVDLGHADNDTSVATIPALEIAYPDSTSCRAGTDPRLTPPPLNVDAPPEFWDLKIEEAVHLALANSEVMRDAGGTVLSDPGAAQTIFDPAIQESDPRFGVNAALADFDASFSAGAFFEKNDRALNNLFEGGGTRLFRQDLNVYQMELAKRTAIGTNLAVRNFTQYDFNNAPGNNVPNLPWGEQVEFSVRQPLLQGAGATFNRIVGRDNIPGFYNGVLIARVNSDISLTNFESAVQELVSQVENAYWELFFAYRDLDAKLEARDRALKTWQQVHTLYSTGQRGGEAEQEWQAREQFYRYDAAVQDALMGRVIAASNSDSLPGRGGVYTSERQLRLVMGLPANDGRLIRPIDSPPEAKIVFDWDQVLFESLDRRVELRRQKWLIARRELQVVASKNYLLPRLDAVGGYRFRGLGEDLLRSDRDSSYRFDNAFQNMTSGDFQEWQLGIDLTVPLGYRRASAAVRNAELLLSRDRAVLREQEQLVVNHLSAAITETQRAYRLAQTNYNRRIAAREQLAALEAVYLDADESEKVRLLDLLLDAQRRNAEAQSDYYRSLAEHAVAIKNVHQEKGSLLDFNEVHLVEGLSPDDLCAGADRGVQPGKPRPWLNAHIPSKPPIVSRGPYAQQLESDSSWTDAPPTTSADDTPELLPPPEAE